MTSEPAPAALARVLPRAACRPHNQHACCWAACDHGCPQIDRLAAGSTTAASFPSSRGHGRQVLPHHACNSDRGGSSGWCLSESQCASLAQTMPCLHFCDLSAFFGVVVETASEPSAPTDTAGGTAQRARGGQSWGRRVVFSHTCRRALRDAIGSTYHIVRAAAAMKNMFSSDK